MYFIIYWWNALNLDFRQASDGASCCSANFSCLTHGADSVKHTSHIVFPSFRDQILLGRSGCLQDPLELVVGGGNELSKSFRAAQDLAPCKPTLALYAVSPAPYPRKSSKCRAQMIQPTSDKRSQPKALCSTHFNLHGHSRIRNGTLLAKRSGTQKVGRSVGKIMSLGL